MSAYSESIEKDVLSRDDAVNLLASAIRGFSTVMATTVIDAERGGLLVPDKARDVAVFVEYVGVLLSAELDSLAAFIRKSKAREQQPDLSAEADSH